MRETTGPNHLSAFRVVVRGREVKKPVLVQLGGAHTLLQSTGGPRWHSPIEAMDLLSHVTASASVDGAPVNAASSALSNVMKTDGESTPKLRVVPE